MATLAVMIPNVDVAARNGLTTIWVKRFARVLVDNVVIIGELVIGYDPLLRNASVMIPDFNVGAIVGISVRDVERESIGAL